VSSRNIFHRLKPAFFAVSGLVIFLLVYNHLLEQARSQGYVLEELDPIMEAAIGLGRRLYWLGGGPLFAPMIIALPIALAFLMFRLIGDRAPGAAPLNRLIVIAPLCFFLMYACGIADGPVSYLIAIAAVTILGYFGLGGPDVGDAGHRKAGKREKLILACIVLFGLIIRLYKLDVFPRFFPLDEQFFAHDALELFGENGDFFGETSWVKTHLVKLMFLRAGFSILGVGMFQARTTSVLEGVLCILLIYYLCRRLWGNAAGVLAAVMLAADPWHIGYSRFGTHNIESPLFLLLIFVLLERAVARGGKLIFACLGMSIGITIYLYQSSYVLAPFSIMAVVAGICFAPKDRRSGPIKELMWLAAGMILAVVPLLTFGRENMAEILSEQTMTKSFMLAAKDYNLHPVVMALTSFRAAIMYIVELTPGPAHPVKGFYLSAVIVGLALMGLGILVGLQKKFGNLMILFWIPVAFLPVSLGYGFAERRIFATFSPIPAMLAALTLGALWEVHPGTRKIQRALSRTLVVFLVAAVTLNGLFIIFEDCDPASGGPAHPRKVPEFISTIPANHTVLISNSIKDFPFLIYIANYDKLFHAGEKKTFSFTSFEELEPLAEKIAHTPHIAVVTDPGASEREFMEKIKRINPQAEIFGSDTFLACIIGGA